MLIISRKIEEGIKIGDLIEVKILGVSAGDKTGSKKTRAASIGIEAPREISILRRELKETREQNLAAARVATLPLAGIAGLLKTKKTIQKPEE